MDAGKFSNFKKLGGLQPKQPGNKAQGQPKESPSVQADPTESFVLGNQPVADAKVDTVAAKTGDAAVNEASSSVTSSVKSNVPTQVEGLGLIAGVSQAGKTNQTFDGLGLHGLNSTSLTSLDGQTLASVNPLKPSGGVKQPTTSVSFVQSTFDMTSLDDSRVTVASFY